MKEIDRKYQPVKLEFLHVAVTTLMQGSITALNGYFEREGKYEEGKINPIDVGLYIGRKIPIDPSYKYFVSYFGDIGTAIREGKLHDYVGFMRSFATTNTNIVIQALDVERPVIEKLLIRVKDNPDESFLDSLKSVLDEYEENDLKIVPTRLNKDIEDIESLIASTVSGVVFENPLSAGLHTFLLRDGVYNFNYLASSILTLTFSHLDHLNQISKRKRGTTKIVSISGDTKEVTNE